MKVDSGQKAVYSSLDVLALRMDEGRKIGAHVSDIEIGPRTRKLKITFYEGETRNSDEMPFIHARALLKEKVNTSALKQTSYKLEGAWLVDDYICVLKYEEA